MKPVTKYNMNLDHEILLHVHVFLSILIPVSGFFDDYGRGGHNVPVTTSGLTNDDALFLTPYIEKGQIDRGQNLAKVPPMLKNVESFAGYLTVNKSTDSNLFFWLFKSQKGDWRKQPLIVWLQGGPGSSSMFGLFSEIGPFSVTKKQKLKRRKYSWNRKYNVVFIDNPVGTGFSFTKQDSGYTTDETDVARDLYEALVQLLKLFPSLQGNKVIVVGESYAGKYVPAIGYKIYRQNQASTFKINLCGLMLGNAWVDPAHMLDFSSYLYKLGLIDEAAKRSFREKQDEMRAHIRAKEYLLAQKLSTDLISEFLRLSGFKYLYDFFHDDIGLHGPEMIFVDGHETRRAIHVGNYTFNDGEETLRHLRGDIMRSVMPWVEELLEAQEFPIMFFSGQLDILVAYPMSVAFYDALRWPRASEYHRAKRCQFKVGNDVAGYYKSAGTFIEVLVRNTGHMAPISQPRWTFELLDRFVTNSSMFWC
nr:PREDICTED: venom serine carboxypeptidase-like [Bemisia tabaci]